MFNNLFDKVTDFNNLFAAYRAARKGKKYDSEILPFEFYAEENLLKLKEQMENEHISMAATANLSSTIPKTADSSRAVPRQGGSPRAMQYHRADF